MFLNGGAHLRMFVAPTTAPLTPGTLSGWQIDAALNFADIYNAAGQAGQDVVALSRFNTRFAALFEKGDESAWQARHGMTAEAYQSTFDLLVRQGYRLTDVCGYSDGTGSRFNAVWQLRDGPAWQARHGLTHDEYQATFDALVQQAPAGLRQRLRRAWPGALCRDLGAAGGTRLAGAARAVAEPVSANLRRDGSRRLRPVQVCGYRVNPAMCASRRFGSAAPASSGSAGTG